MVFMGFYGSVGAFKNFLFSSRYNVAQLEQWARDQMLEDSGNKVIDPLLPVIQATQLLQVIKGAEP